MVKSLTVCLKFTSNINFTVSLICIQTHANCVSYFQEFNIPIGEQPYNICRTSLYTNLEGYFTLNAGVLSLTPYGDQCNVTQMYKTIITNTGISDYEFCLRLLWKVSPLQTFTLRSDQCHVNIELHKNTKGLCKLFAVYTPYYSCASGELVHQKKISASHTQNGIKYNFHSTKTYYGAWGNGEVILFIN